MKVAYRIDDVSIYMNEKNFMRIEELFNKYDIKPLIGVIPDNKDPKLIKYGKVNFDFWEKIKELQGFGWTIAVHGYNHKYITNNPGLLKYPDKSEFAGVNIRTQNKKIKNAIRIFRHYGINTNIFMAPSHSFDLNTLKVLEEMNFKYITDGLNIVKYKLKRCNLEFIPQVSSRILKLFFSTQTICLHVNNWDGKEFTALEREISFNRKCICSYNELLRIKSYKYNSVFKLIEKVILITKTSKILKRRTS